MASRRVNAPSGLIVVLVLVAGVVLAASVWAKSRSLADPTWIGLALLGLSMLILALGVGSASRRH